MFTVQVTNKGQLFYLRGTAWAFTRERADTFQTAELANAAWLRASKFAHSSIKKNVRVVEGV